MSRQRNVTMADAAMFGFRDGVKSSTRENSGREQIYVDDGRQITTTFTKFCLEIENNAELFQPRPTKGRVILPAYTFNLVSGDKDRAEVLATVFPLTSNDVSTVSFNVHARSAPDLKHKLHMGEPVILKRDGKAFAVMCPADKYVWSRIQDELAPEMEPA